MGHRPGAIITTAGFLLTSAALVATAQQKGDAHAPWVSCFDSAGRFLGPKNVRTDTVSSTDGNLRAYAEISAAGRNPDCENTVWLFVSLNKAPYRVVFKQAPSVRIGTADSLGPVAWSPNGRWLAVEFGYWFYASDNASQGLLLYDSLTQATSRPAVIQQIERALGKNCELQLRSVAGFDSQNRVVLRVADQRDEEGHSNDCINGTADWLYDPATGAAIPITRK